MFKLDLRHELNEYKNRIASDAHVKESISHQMKTIFGLVRVLGSPIDQKTENNPLI